MKRSQARLMKQTCRAAGRLSVNFLYGMFGMEIRRACPGDARQPGKSFHAGNGGRYDRRAILPPYYSLRLLPYVVPHIATWKRRVLREREFTDEHDYHLDGLVGHRWLDPAHSRKDPEP